MSRWYCAKTARHIARFFRPSDSPVFCFPKWDKIAKFRPSNCGQKYQYTLMAKVTRNFRPKSRSDKATGIYRMLTGSHVRTLSDCVIQEWPWVTSNSYFSNLFLCSDVKSSRPKWPRPQTFGLGLASISLSYYVIRHFSGKNRLKFGNFVNFSGNNLKSYVVNHYLVLFS